MPSLQTARVIESCGSVLEDRAEVFERGSGLVVVVADGAGGIAGGAQAAQAVVRAVGDACAGSTSLHDPEFWSRFFHDVDAALANDPESGETTAVVAVVSPAGITGASVGDSGAWLITPNEYVELTAGQQRKPLLGTGAAVPVSFVTDEWEGTLLLASDGLLKYAGDERICEVASETDLQAAAERLVDMVRLRSGDLPDDVALVLCRRKGGQP